MEGSMVKVLLWAILAAWVGIALAILAAVVTTIAVSSARMVRDRFGVKGQVYCPVDERTFSVVGMPTSFGDAPFDDLRSCEKFESGEIRCQKSCLRWERSATV
jgi:hypothetical protein